MLTSADVMRFCVPNWRRYDLAHPWIVNSKLYATNGRVIIRCDLAVYTGELATGKRPHVADIFTGIDKVSEWHPLPAWPACERCNGSGRVFRNLTETEECTHCVMDFAGRKITRYRMLPILALPDCTWGVLEGKGEVVFFQFPGGEAVAAASDES